MGKTEFKKKVEHLLKDLPEDAYWDASGAASGLYLYRLQAGDFEQSRTMTLVK